jgi:hypothetical protein
MDQLELRFEWLPADPVEGDPRSKLRHRSVDRQPMAVRVSNDKAAWVASLFDEDLRRG